MRLFLRILTPAMTDDFSTLDNGTVLVTGADGMLGRAFREVMATIAPRSPVVALDHRALDVTDRAAVLAQAVHQPRWILHCAAHVDADACERHPAGCEQVQVGGTRHVIELARACGAQIVYPQSVFIFDGRELPVTEETTPTPPFAYGRYKLEAERLLLAEPTAPLIVRMAGFFGGDDKDKNFVGKFARQLRTMLQHGERRCIVGARVWQPTYTIDLARNTLLLVAMRRSGLYHMGAKGEASFFDVAVAMVQLLGLADRIEVCAGDPEVEAREPATRPRRMVTATRRLDREGLNRQRHWHEALAEYLARPSFDDLRRRPA